MEIAFHIGPHKTGTTSVQRFLLKRFGSPEPATPFWYPTPSEHGPGHAKLKKDPAALRSVVDAAEAGGVQTLVLSSENFSLSYRNGFAEQAEALAGHDLHLIVTMSPILRRSASYWQEMKKHGDTTPLDRVCDIVLDHPGFQPDLVDVASEALRAKQVSVILTDPMHSPERLLNSFLEALGVDDYVVDGIDANRSLGLIEAEILQSFNIVWKAHAHPNKNYDEARSTLMKTLRSDEWRRVCPIVPIPISDEAEAALLQRERATMDRIIELRDSARVRLIGTWDLDF